MKNMLKRFWGKGVYPHQLSFLLDSAVRRLILSPERLADRLRLKPDSHVLEVGSGPGYFSVEVGRRVPRGRLVLLDLQREMLLKARRKVAAAGLQNVSVVQADASALPFREASFDVVFLAAVLGEVHDPGACLRAAFAVLRTDGILSVTEQPGDPDALPASTIRSLAAEAGFYFTQRFGKRRSFTLNFGKRPPVL